MNYQSPKTKIMKMKSKAFLLAIALCGSAFLFNACNDNPPPSTPTPTNPTLSTSPLYDTLGWFIQGGQGMVAGSGTEMIADPDNPGQKIQAGRYAIRTVVNTALPIIAGDTALDQFFPVLLAELGANNTTGYAMLLETFTDFVQQAISGQQIYMGLSMVAAHSHATNNRFGSAANPVSDDDDFDQFVADIVVAAQSLSVPPSVIAQLGVVLNSVRGDVVQG